MKPRPANVPLLGVEGVDDISTVAGLLYRSGYDTKQGQQYLYLRAYGSSSELLDAMQDVIKAERSAPCGFVLDIDIAIKRRWQAVVDRLRFEGDPTTELEAAPPSTCPKDGYIGRVKGYPHPFGVWLMPDCSSDDKKLEDLIATLIPEGHPLKDYAAEVVDVSLTKIEEANSALAEGSSKWRRFSNPDKIKAVVRTWLAWQEEPGLAFGAAINQQILASDSPEARALMDWLHRLFKFAK